MPAELINMRHEAIIEDMLPVLEELENMKLNIENREPGTSTRLISTHLPDDRFDSRPVVTPIYQSSTYRRPIGFGTKDGVKATYVYQRNGNPNVEEACLLINSIEKGAGTCLFPSGMAALSNTIMCFLKPGDHIIAGAPLFSCIQKVFDQYFKQFDVEVTYVPSYGTIEDYRKAVKPNTRILYGETICNPMMWVLDIECLGKLGQELGIMTICDATFSSPINQNLISWGIDAVVHSSTKYIGGHSDMLSGCCTLRKEEDYQKLKTWNIFMGPTSSPFDAVLLVRSLRTLDLRMQKVNSNALQVAQYLEKHPFVERVLYCGLESHPQHQLSKKIMTGFGGMLTIELASKEQAICVVETTKIFNPAFSLGGVECLIEHISTMSHGDFALTPKQRAEAGIKDSMLRLSIGIENVEDIINDIDTAICKAVELHPSPEYITDKLIKNGVEAYQEMKVAISKFGLCMNRLYAVCSHKKLKLQKEVECV